MSEPPLPPESASPAVPPERLLPDPWTGALPLNGWLERHQFAPLLVAFLGLLICFLLFQGIGTVVSLAGLVARDGTVPQTPEALETAMEASPDLMLLGNTIGQFLGLGLPALLLAMLITRKRWDFLRLRKPDSTLFQLSVWGLLPLLPVVVCAQFLNEQLPMPEWVYVLQESQQEFLENALASGKVSLWANLFAVAVTPALCEEVLFRGVIQRQFERTWGVTWTIVIIGLLFGLYHMQFLNVLPLGLLGAYMAFITWRTGSLWPAIVVHFLNNALAIFLVTFTDQDIEVDAETLSTFGPMGYVLFISGVAVGGFLLWRVIHMMNERANRLLQSKQEDSDA